jgi:hypothetical protein
MKSTGSYVDRRQYPVPNFWGVADEPEEFGHLQSIIEMDDLEESINQLHQQSF